MASTPPECKPELHGTFKVEVDAKGLEVLQREADRLGIAVKDLIEQECGKAVGRLLKRLSRKP